MPGLLENRITAIVPDPKNYTLILTWANGARTLSRFSHLVGKGVFAAFNEPGFFAQVQIAEEGQSIEWPGEIDIHADSLWFEAHPEDNPFHQPVERTSEPLPPVSADTSPPHTHAP